MLYSGIVQSRIGFMIHPQVASDKHDFNFRECSRWTCRVDFRGLATVIIACLCLNSVTIKTKHSRARVLQSTAILFRID